MCDESVTQGGQGGDSDFKPADGPASNVLGTPDSPPHVEVDRTVSLPPSLFHPDSIDGKLLNEQQQRRNSSSALSSLNQECGDDQQLADIAKSKGRVRSAPGDREDLIFAVGARFASEETNPRKPTIGGAYNNVLSQTEGVETPEPQEKTLQHDISVARVDTVGKRDHFLPLDCLVKLITEQSIQYELRKLNPELYSDLVPVRGDPSSLTAEILNVKVKQRRNTSRRKIFAILVMMQRPEAILDVIREKIYDYHLPFQFGKSTETDVFSKAREGEVAVPIDFFRHWNITSRESFKNYQWEMTAPYFRLSWKEGMRVYEYVLEPRTILPFIEEATDTGNQQREITYSGGTSYVRKLKIHPAHHNYKKQSTNPYFAVKTLRWSEELAKKNGKDLNREALALKRFVDKKHEHLMRLLATFTHGGHFHLIFPCADGNLLEFWRDYHPDPTKLEHNRGLAPWLATQLKGLASALKSIHLATVQNANSGNLPEALWDKRHGRHGDLKPENILWFKESSGQGDSMGVLKISDFGFADFHRTNSIEMTNFSSVGGLTPTYRAPEHDIARNVPKQGLITPACDIWSLGCVFLEFVTWYLRGWTGVDEYSENRVQDSESDPKQDDFFHSRDRGREVESKRSVAVAFRDLKTNPDCSDFILELLEFIQDKMLKINHKDRAACEEIFDTLSKMAARCVSDPTYCTERTREIQHRSTDLSVAAVIYSLPQPGQSGDPINGVNATDITRARSLGSRRGSDAMVVYSKRLNMVAETDRSFSRNSSPEDREIEQQRSRRLGPMAWAHGIFKACCCIEDGAQ